MDVGALSLDTDTAKTSLVARRLPDVADLVSGVVYTARAKDDDGIAFPVRGHYVLRAAGSPDLDVAPFAVESSVIGEPADVRIAGLEPRAGEKLLVSATRTVDVTWARPSTSTTEAAESDDVVYIDVSSAGAATTRCLFADNGRATLTGSSFGDGDGTVTTHRLHREVFHARGIDAGELRFDFARAISFRRR
jgi:hypothetical protein